MDKKIPTDILDFLNNIEFDTLKTLNFLNEINFDTLSLFDFEIFDDIEVNSLDSTDNPVKDDTLSIPSVNKEVEKTPTVKTSDNIGSSDKNITKESSSEDISNKFSTIDEKNSTLPAINIPNEATTSNEPVEIDSSFVNFSNFGTLGYYASTIIGGMYLLSSQNVMNTANLDLNNFTNKGMIPVVSGLVAGYLLKEYVFSWDNFYHGIEGVKSSAQSIKDGVVYGVNGASNYLTLDNLNKGIENIKSGAESAVYSAQYVKDSIVSGVYKGAENIKSGAENVAYGAQYVEDSLGSGVNNIIDNFYPSEETLHKAITEGFTPIE